MAPTRNLWTIVLAAGAGRRLASITGSVPKQYWRDGVAPSLLESTLERFAPLAPPQRTMVVVDRSHAQILQRHPAISDAATILYQPQDRGTAAGVLFAIEPVRQLDPHAIVVLTPSDHGVADDARFRHGVLEAAKRVKGHGGVVLFGVAAETNHDDYGWIVRGSPVPGRCGHLHRVESFVEKPSRPRAAALLASGALWNTMVLVARVRDLHELFVTATPELLLVFEDAARLSPDDRSAFLTGAYSHLPVSDFSHHVLGSSPDLLVYEWPATIGWSDLGTPERLHRWQTRGRRWPAQAGAA
jgi:mannose-1-phosphate guanylyltransferase